MRNFIISIILLWHITLCIVSCGPGEDKNSVANRWYNSDKELATKYLSFMIDSFNMKTRTSIALKGYMPTYEETLIAYTMAGLGFWQVANTYKEHKAICMEYLEKCIDTIMSEEIRQLSTDSWEYDPLKHYKLDNAHGLYLGYLNTLLSLHQHLGGKKYSKLNNELTNLLYAKMRKYNWKLPSYGTRIFFPDNAVIMFSMYINYKVRDIIPEVTPSIKLEVWYIKEFHKLFDKSNIYYDEGSSSYVIFSLFIASYMIPNAYLSKYVNEVEDKLVTSTLTFKGIKEYPLDEDPKTMDYDRDAGPIIYGIGTTGTGYMLGICKLNKRPILFADIYKTVKHVGNVYIDDKYYYFKLGGFTENAIMFSILTSNRNII